MEVQTASSSLTTCWCVGRMGEGGSRLTMVQSRDPATFWTSGQHMTERTGGSDLSNSETIAREQEDGSYRLYGYKFFTSATTSEMAIGLARTVDREGKSVAVREKLRGRGLIDCFAECSAGHSWAVMLCGAHASHLRRGARWHRSASPQGQTRHQSRSHG